MVLSSPGYGEDRALGTDLTEDLTSHGYVVAAIDHTYDATEIAFPKNRLVLRHQPEPTTEALAAGIRIRVADARFVLDELTSLNHGDNPDAERRSLPQGTSRGLNLATVGMFGHSLGGATTAGNGFLTVGGVTALAAVVATVAGCSECTPIISARTGKADYTLRIGSGLVERWTGIRYPDRHRYRCCGSGPPSACQQSWR